MGQLSAAVHWISLLAAAGLLLAARAADARNRKKSLGGRIVNPKKGFMAHISLIGIRVGQGILIYLNRN